MSNLVTKYHNNINQLDLKGWTANEINLFFAIITKAKNHGTDEVVITRSELLKLLEVKDHEERVLPTPENMINLLKKYQTLSYIEVLQEKIKGKDGSEDDSTKVKMMNFFQTLTYQWNKDNTENTLTVKLNEEYEYIINKFSAEFTQFEFKEFVNLNSTYAKLAYKLLKQWRKQGHTKKYSINEFKQLMGLPSNYPNKELKRQIIKPILAELTPIFHDLDIVPEYKGQRITAYTFTFKPEITGAYIEGQPRTKRKKKPAELPDWYYKDDPGKPDPEMLKELYRMLGKE